MEYIIKQYERCFRDNRDLPALTDYFSAKTYSYLQLAARVGQIHDILRDRGILKGDKVALAGRNSIDWISAYIGIVTYGAVVVPILADFNPADMAGIVNHSDSSLFLADRALLGKIPFGSLTSVKTIVALEDLPEPVTEGFDIDGIRYADVGAEDTIIISYTSGTTGTSKGVMLPVRSITNNVNFAVDHSFHFKGSRVLALLPLAHAYGCAFDMLTPLAVGAHVYVLGRMPVPSVLMEALKTVRPHLVCAVPLVMEKIVRKSVLPKLQKKPLKTLCAIPGLNRIVYNKVRAQMLEAFGGCVKEVNMGGAALSKDVERFLKKIRFPFTIGYGMTECGPLISYDGWKDFRSGSCGRILPGMEVKLLKDGYKGGLGEICVKGVNVMTGYYKNPEATQAALEDGWLHTGDVGKVDGKGRIYLRGRSKTMILTSAGQNIYPEEIEGKLNHMDGVGESLVYEEKGKLMALVVPDAEFMKKISGDLIKIKDQMMANLRNLNSLVAPYEKVSKIDLCSESFEKTPKQSIKRFLYPRKAKKLE